MSQYSRLVEALSRIPKLVAEKTTETLSRASASFKQADGVHVSTSKEVERPIMHEGRELDSEAAQGQRQLHITIAADAKQPAKADTRLQRSNRSQVVHKPVGAKRFVEDATETERNPSTGKHDFRLVNRVVDYSITNPEHAEHATMPTIRTRKVHKPTKLQELDNKRKNLLGQLSKLEEELQEINVAKDSVINMSVSHDDPSMKALELVRKMNDQRKKREERVRIETDRIKRAKAEREEQERRRQEEIERLHALKRMQQEADERKRREELQFRKKRQRAEQVRSIALSIVREVVSMALGEAAPLDESRSKQSNSSSLFVLSRNKQGSDRSMEASSIITPVSHGLAANKKHQQASTRFSKGNKRDLGNIVLRLDKKTHHYPTNLFRQQILQEERRKRQMERELEEQRRKVVDLRRLHNLPPIRPRNLNSLEVSTANLYPNQSLRQSNRRYDRGNTKNEDQSTISQRAALRTEEAEQVEQTSIQPRTRDGGVQYESPEHQELPKQPFAEEPAEQAQPAAQHIEQVDPTPEADQDVQVERLDTKQSELSEEPEMQFFKSSNPVATEAEPVRPKSATRIEEAAAASPSEHPASQNGNEVEQVLLEEQAQFYNIFEADYFLRDENAAMRDLATRILAERGFTIEQASAEEFVFDQF